MLAQLKFSDVAKRGGADDQTTRVRSKVLAALGEQREALTAAIERREFKATRKVGGEVRERRFRPWWFRSAGFFYVTINYGASAMLLNGTSKSIEAGPKIEDVLTVFDHVTAAINAGELDKVLLEAAGKRGRKRGDKGQQQAPSSPAQAPGAPKQGAPVSGSARARNRG